MKVAILGCGLIGEKRGKQLTGHQIVGVFDPDQAKAKKLSQELKTKAYDSEDKLLSGSGAEIVIIATTNNKLAPLAIKAAGAKIHILVEKPGAITLKELETVEAVAKKNKVAIKIGFNHRFHPALLKARELIDQGALGEMMFLRARYGHGGRLGMEKEWRSVPEIAGGGELLDQGIHVLDLIFWIMGPLSLQSSYVTTSFWKTKVDDNAVLTLANENSWATMHVSSTEWKNTFDLEIYGHKGKILINGLGRSYGKETLTYYKMLPEMGPPEIQNFDFPETDLSWELDMKNLVDHIQKGTPLWGDINSAKYALSQIRQAYKQNGFGHLPCSV
jgi:predicted dehydrogenase